MSLSRLHEIAGCDAANRNADVVFVHGLGGISAATPHAAPFLRYTSSGRGSLRGRFAVTPRRITVA
jgi:hypothetical protein